VCHAVRAPGSKVTLAPAPLPTGGTLLASSPYEESMPGRATAVAGKIGKAL